MKDTQGQVDPRQARQTNIAASVACWAARVAATLALAMGLLRFLYATASGNALLDLVPDSAWEIVHRALGIRRTGNVEAAQNTDEVMTFLACLLVAAGLVAVFTGVGRRIASSKHKHAISG